MKPQKENEVLFHTVLDLDKYVSRVTELTDAVALELRPGVRESVVVAMLTDTGVAKQNIRYNNASRIMFVRGCRIPKVEALDWLQKYQLIRDPQRVVNVPIKSVTVAEQVLRGDLEVKDISSPETVFVRVTDYMNGGR